LKAYKDTFLNFLYKFPPQTLEYKIDNHDLEKEQASPSGQTIGLEEEPPTVLMEMRGGSMTKVVLGTKDIIPQHEILLTNMHDITKF
jgi:hypothetical protein